MRILTTFLPASSGTASVVGYDVMAQSMEVRQNIGYLPESVPLYPEMRVEEYLDYRARLKGLDRHQRNVRLSYAIDRGRIEGVRRRLIGTLSRGYRQRVGLADALLSDPRVLIMDEPTSGLDPAQIKETLSIIKSLVPDHTVLLSTHHLPEVEQACERIIIINKGKIQFDSNLAVVAESSIPKILLEIRGPKDAVKDWLQKQSGVEQVDLNPLGDDWTLYSLQLKTPDDIREKLAKGIAKQDWGLRHLAQRVLSIEDIYMNVIFGKS